MTEQPTALRLADEIAEMLPKHVTEPVATELRRLHDLAIEQQGKIYALEMARSMEQKTAKLKRDALLSALLWIDKRCPQAFMDCPLHTIHREMAHDAGARARAAIKNAEGEKE